MAKIPLRWQHVAVWGGLRGALALALALSLEGAFPYREQILNLTFGVVTFSILGQALTMRPLLRILRIAPATLKSDN
jgi:CPA1 family monovalent cation:H+ antiporter